MSEREELLCEVCGVDYPVWFAPNPLWNAAVRHDGRDDYSFLCPTCFMRLADEHNGSTGPWVVTDETTGHEQAAALAYTLREVVIQAEAALTVYRDGSPDPDDALVIAGRLHDSEIDNSLAATAAEGRAAVLARDFAALGGAA